MKYITVANATTKYNNMLPVTVVKVEDNDYIEFDVWADAEEGERENALKQATHVINTMYHYNGRKYDPEQDNQFPRVGHGPTTCKACIPEEVKDATLHLALHFLKILFYTRFMSGQLRRYVESGAQNYSVGFGDASESVTVGKWPTAHDIIYPFLKRFVKGSYRLTAYK